MAGRLRKRDHIAEFAFEGHLVLLDKAADRLLLYNHTAAMLWAQLAEGSGLDDLARVITDHHGIPLETVQADCAAIVDQWRTEGLIGPEPAKPPRPAAAAEARSSAGRVPPLEPAERWTCRFRDLTFAFAFENGARAAYARRLFDNHDEGDPAGAIQIEVREEGGGWASVREQGIERLRTDVPEEVFGAISQYVLERLYPGTRWLAIIHGGAVAAKADGHTIGIVFPASSGSGKTTLVGWLSARGFDYLTDDFTAIAAPDGLIMPWPVPLNVKQGSWAVLEPVHPALSDAPEYEIRGMNARLLRPPPTSWSHPPVRLDRLIFPRYRAGAAARLERLTPVQALERLLTDRIWLGYPKTEAQVAAFLAWLGGIDCHQLEHGDLTEAETCIRSLID